MSKKCCEDVIRDHTCHNMIGTKREYIGVVDSCLPTNLRETKAYKVLLTVESLKVQEY